jgi:AraC-like DNA-binding protein
MARGMTDGQWLERIGSGALRFRCSLAGHSVLGSEWRPHRNRRVDQHLLYAVSDGCLRLTLHDLGSERLLRGGSLMWLAPGIRHSIERHAASSVTLFHARVESLDEKDALAVLDASVSVFDGCRHVQPFIEGWWREERRAGGARPLALRGWWLLLWSELLTKRDQRAGGLDGERLAAVQRAVERHLRHGLTPAELAAAAGLHPAYFTRCFRATFGTRPRLWLVAERLRLAQAMLLESAEPIAAIAARLGYASVALFIRQFQARFGESPGRWRRGQRGG